jgi:hypothetical protein
MLDLDEMKQMWTERDKTLDEIIRLNRQLLTAVNMQGTRWAVYRMTALSAFEAAVWFAIVVALGGFIYAHASTLRFALAGAAVDLFAIGMLAVTVRQIVAARQIDYAKPIAVIQKQLEALRLLRIRITQWALLAGAVVWGPFAMVVLKAFWDVDFHNAAWLWANVLFGLSLIPLALWLSKRFGDRMGNSPSIQRLMRDLAGHNLTAALAFLANLSQFEDEGQAAR